MARISKEPIHRLDKRTTELIDRDLIVVKVVSFTFGFRDAAQLRTHIDYFSQKTRPSSRLPAKVLAADLGEDWREQRGWEVERWFERLPMYLLEEPKRQKVLKALTKALKLVEGGKL